MNEREIIKYDLSEQDYLVKNIPIRHKLSTE